MDHRANSSAIRGGDILPPSRAPVLAGRRAPTIDIYPAFDDMRATAPLRGRPAPRQRVPIWLWAALFAAAAVTVAIGLRGRIVETIPALSEAYSAVGLPAGPSALELTDISLIRVYSRGLTGINFGGAVSNPTGRQIEIPPIELAIRDSAGNVLRSQPLVPARTSLDPGGSTRFAVEIADPPAGAFDLAVRLGSAPPRIIPIN